MIPSIDILTEEITEPVYPTKTYKINFNIPGKPPISKSSVLGVAILGHMTLGTDNDISNDKIKITDKISGYIDDLESVTQSIYLILSTERYQHIIYSWDYGVELLDLIGKPIPYVMSEIPNRIIDALTQDDRIETVTDFEFTATGKQLHVKFTVVSTIGNIPTELEVDV